MLNINCDINLIFNAIKADNLAVFSQQINGNFNISFGRFPLLTVCYLYNAKKIYDYHNESLISFKEINAKKDK